MRTFIVGHEVVTAFECGWGELENGDLLAAMEAESFDVLVTTDQSLRHQQNISDHRFGVIVLMTTRWPLIRENPGLVVESLASIEPGKCIEVHFPLAPEVSGLR